MTKKTWILLTLYLVICLMLVWKLAEHTLLVNNEIFVSGFGIISVATILIAYCIISKD